jgi:hypothetical protein
LPLAESLAVNPPAALTWLEWKRENVLETPPDRLPFS